MPASASSLSVLSPVARATLEPLSAGESIRLVQALKAIPDPRQRRGRRHGLQSVLLLALQAVMAGASSWVAIAQWATTAPQGHRPGWHRRPRLVPARPPGDQGRPTAPHRWSPALDRDRLRDHLAGLPRRRPAAAGRLAARTLVDREQRPPRPRRDPA